MFWRRLATGRVQNTTRLVGLALPQTVCLNGGGQCTAVMPRYASQELKLKRLPVQSTKQAQSLKAETLLAPIRIKRSQISGIKPAIPVPLCRQPVSPQQKPRHSVAPFINMGLSRRQEPAPAQTRMVSLFPAFGRQRKTLVFRMRQHVR